MAEGERSTGAVTYKTDDAAALGEQLLRGFQAVEPTPAHTIHSGNKDTPAHTIHSGNKDTPAHIIHSGNNDTAPPPPPIPDQVWFGVWGSDADSNNFTSLVWDIWDDATIEQQGGPALRFLYQVGQFFCTVASNKTWSFYPDYQTRWNRAVPKLRQLLQKQKILGFMLGDESVDKGLSTDHWGTIIQTVRATFPRGTAIIYANDYVCREPNCTDHGKPCRCIEHIPAALDWISSATYRTNSSSGFIGSIRASYENHIYPKLHPHQKVAVIPEAGSADDICDDECMTRIELQDAKDTVAWAHNDSRVALIAPYLWSYHDGCDGHRCDEGMKEISGADDLRKYYWDFGRSTKHAKSDEKAKLLK
jgi:hypothetical protein